jgi:hypothetical protein
MENQIIECAPSYKLKCDGTNGLRDLTFEELKKIYKKNIRCPCWGHLTSNHEIRIDKALSLPAHFKSCVRHQKWREEQQKEYTKKYGHCTSFEEIVETQRKELQTYKKNYADLVKTKDMLDKQLIIMNNKQDDNIKENESICNELEESQTENELLRYEVKESQTENELLRYELKESQIEIESINKNNVILIRENNRYKLIKETRKKNLSIKGEVRPAFR